MVKNKRFVRVVSRGFVVSASALFDVEPALTNSLACGLWLVC